MFKSLGVILLLSIHAIVLGQMRPLIEPLPDSTGDHDYRIRWTSQAGSGYAIERSLDLKHWELHEEIQVRGKGQMETIAEAVTATESPT